MRSTLLAFAVALIATACSSTADMAARPVQSSAVFDRAVEPLSACAVERLSGQTRNLVFRRLFARPIVTIEAEIASQFTGVGVQYQIDFAPTANGGATSVSIRTRNTIWGTPIYDDFVWPTIRACAEDYSFTSAPSAALRSSASLRR